MMAGWQPAETAPETGLSQEAKRIRASSDTRRPCTILLAARKDGHKGRSKAGALIRLRKVRFESALSKRDGSPWGLRLCCGSAQGMGAEKDRVSTCPSLHQIRS